MTARSSRDHKKAELQARLMARVANRAFTRKDSGLDGMAKTLLNKRAGEVPHDPELDHDE